VTGSVRGQDPIRPARAQDVAVLLQLVRELAAYEREPDAVEATEAMLHDALFGGSPTASCHVATDPTGEVVGFALWYVTFSTWKGRPGMWLEDLFVRPQARGSGLGRALLETLAGVCAERGYARFEWWVLDWNAPAHGFYRSLGARPEDEWTVWRVDGEELHRLGSRAAQPAAQPAPAATASPSAVARRQAAVVPRA
jgi:GNAT superfamily N-acetyltransferase